MYSYNGYLKIGVFYKGISWCIQQLVLIVLLILPIMAVAQNNLEVKSFGSDVGGTMMSLGTPANPISSQYHFFVNHEISQSFTGETNLGLVFLSDNLRKSRLFSLDYRALYSLKSYVNWKNRQLDPYLYAGVGVARYQLLNVRVQDSPLLKESERKISNTSLWNNGNGWALQIPFGLGLDYQLSEEVSLRLNSGYHLSSRSVINSDSGFKGYLGATIGMKFTPFSKNKKSSVRPKPGIRAMDKVGYSPLADFPSDKVPVVTIPPAVVDIPPADAILGYRVFDPIYYQTLEYQLPDETPDSIQEIVTALKADSALKVKIFGHADYRGNEVMNQSLSNMRSWEVMKLLIKEGVHFSRIHVAGYGEEQVSFERKSDEELAESRRTEMELTYQLPEIEEPNLDDLANLPALPTGNLLIPSSVIQFQAYSDQLSDEAKRWLAAVANYMKSNKEARIQIIGLSNSSGSASVNKMLRHARAVSTARFLLQSGVTPSRFEIDYELRSKGNSRGVHIRQDYDSKVNRD